MKPSNELFVLIKSLTKSEKRFFKLSSAIQTGEKNYLKIFDFIDGLTSYDEELLKEEFKHETFVKHLPSEKNHLYKLILKSLRSFYSEQSSASILKEELKNLEILYNKALYKECRKFLKRAKKIAIDHEKFYYLIELMSWEKLLIEESYESGDFDVDLNQIIEEESEVVAKLRNLAEYHILYSRINAIFRSGGFARTEQEKDTVREISDNYLIKGKNTAISTRAASICYYIKGLCAWTNREFSESYTYFNRTKEILDKNPKLKQDLGKRYTLTLFHLMRSYVDDANFDMAQEMIEKIRSLKDKKGFKSIDLSLKITSISIIDQMNLFNLRGKFVEAYEFYQSNKKEVDTIINKASKEQRIKLQYTTVYTLFGLQDYKGALNVLNEILNDNEQKLRQDIYSFARILNLMIHFELNNYQLIDYSANSTLRYLKKIDRNYNVEVFFVKQMKKLSKSILENAEVNFIDLKNGLDDYIKDNRERVILDYIDVVSWATAKVEGISFEDAIKQKLELTKTSS